MEISMLYGAGAEIKKTTDEAADLIERARNGDDAAFGLIFERHYRFIYKFIYAMRGDAHLAEELTQETFLAAYRSLHALRGEAKLQTWLCGIAKNTVYKSLRGDRKEGRRADEPVESFDVADGKTERPDRQFLSGELNRAIGAALARLDPDKRLIFTLKELQNLSYREISEITGYSVPKLKTDLHRAKCEMRNRLRPYLEVNDEM